VGFGDAPLHAFALALAVNPSGAPAVPAPIVLYPRAAVTVGLGCSQLIADELRSKTSGALASPLAFTARDASLTLWAAAALSLRLDVGLGNNLLAIFDHSAASARCGQ
jgi:hypothetical protein